jgi:glycosyltransferase involved in cell wall biosynthesis
MNILYLTNHLNIGGITSYVLSLASGLKKRGHNIYVASSGGNQLSRLTEEDINYIPIPIKTKNEFSPKILLSMFKLLGIIKRYDIEIAHSNSRSTQVLGCLLSKLSSVKHISTCHGFFKKRFSRRAFPCWGIKVLAISEAVKEHLMRDFSVKEECIKVVHNGIDVSKRRAQSAERKAEVKRKFGLSEGLVVGIVARLSDVKGHVYLIKAMREVLNRVLEAQLLIVGEGKMKSELVRLVKNLGMSKKVFFVPEVEDVSEVLSIMDIFVMPSLKEGLGLALMEAMASGLAVIGSDVGGIKSLIQHGHNGLLVAPRDVQGLRDAILELIPDLPKRELLGKRAEEFISESFPLEKMVLETEKAYSEC